MAQVTYQQFMSALSSVQEACMKGDDDSIKKFSTVLRKLMPEEMAVGKYRMLGGLLMRLDELMPLFSSSRKPDPLFLRKMEHHGRDILETVDFVLRKLSSGQGFDPAQVKETIEILAANIKGMEKLRNKRRDAGEPDLPAKPGRRGLVCHPSAAAGKLIAGLLEKYGMKLSLAAGLDEVSTYLYFFEGEYETIMLDISFIRDEEEKQIRNLQKLSPGSVILVTAPEGKLGQKLEARLAALGCRILLWPTVVSDRFLRRLKEALLA